MIPRPPRYIWTPRVSRDSLYYKICLILLEPLILYGEGEYNLNSVKEIKALDSFYSLDIEDQGCQTQESIIDCQTRYYMDSIVDACGCLPLSIRISKEVNGRVYISPRV